MTDNTVLDVDPRWASAPGVTIRRSLAARGLDAEDLADKLGVSDPDARRLLTGETSITADVAALLAELLGSTAAFWQTREAQYRESLHLLDADDLASRAPLKDMVKQGWLPEASSWKDTATSVLSFFDVEDSAEWERKWGSRLRETDFRGSPTYESQDVSVAAWLRQAELSTRNIRTETWSPAELRKAASELRGLSRVGNPEVFLPRAQRLLAEAGVALVLIKATAGNRLSGAALRLEDGRRAIALTGRHLAEDHLWFTLFHEIGHLLLHGARDDFLDSLDADDIGDSAVEDQANDWARAALIPTGIDSLGNGRAQGPTRREILGFASDIGIAPGIVVGQLHHAGKLQPNQHRPLIRHYRWVGTSLGI
ncbi:hypothetical protein DEJ03_07995 [Curtobacterium sp. MCLR17_043]|uniref:ImmA/IrrE family metallo-endopeptidase n=1 Tax=Curtobacterium sp. MCLR17_043 TaxID=2175627 RepID=UPI000D94A301|nr:ImmA/IrrE family metallo-endopeptidase [Curtobacterium sp. MCLR17_043]PYY46414.1 hypothetical protein DEJ03_07995 [Curtobacterium sp. MCLR17_043]